MDFGGIGGGLLVLLIIVGIVCAIAWLWIVWVAVGELMVWLVIKDTVILHVFLWALGLAMCSTAIHK